MGDRHSDPSVTLLSLLVRCGSELRAGGGARISRAKQHSAPGGAKLPSRVPELVSPELDRLYTPIADDDFDTAEGLLPAVLERVDTPTGAPPAQRRAPLSSDAEVGARDGAEHLLLVVDLRPAVTGDS
jgi:hypothetical protein